MCEHHVCMRWSETSGRGVGWLRLRRLTAVRSAAGYKLPMARQQRDEERERA
jgi:hypothetical protein